MAPRALTDQEKAVQREHILQKGRNLVLSSGIRKISVDDIAKAAGIAKGSFYNYFADKEQFLMELVKQFHQEMFKQAEDAVHQSTRENLRENMENLVRSFFKDSTSLFFMEHHVELNLLLSNLSADQATSFSDMEKEMFTNIIEQAGFDPKVIKPGVVHNLFHAMYSMKGSDLMMTDSIDESFEILLKALMDYILDPR